MGDIFLKYAIAFNDVLILFDFFGFTCQKVIFEY